jgi:hypothetical protein
LRLDGGPSTRRHAGEARRRRRDRRAPPRARRMRAGWR